MTTKWTRVANRDDLSAKGRLVVRSGARQLALFETPAGVLACNNRCPHEGYPLSEGTLDDGCVVTCNWHNWKFDLSSGENLYGGDGLRVYPAEQRGEDVWVDLADPPFAERHASVMGNLRAAFDDNDYARMARELGRLRVIGADPLDAARAAIAWSHDRLEFGWMHGYAGLADWLEVLHDHPHDEETQLGCLLEGIAHVADDVLREPPHPYPEGTEPYDEERFVGALEREDAATATALVRGALAAGAGFDAVESGFARAALAHYHAFGHSVIYLTKARRLVERLGAAVAEPVLVALVRQLVFARREDLIPEFRGYARALERFGSTGERVEPAMEAWRGLGIEKSLAALVRTSGAPPRAIFAALLGANAANLLDFDLARQGRPRIPVSDNVSWLDLTHGLTFAAAVDELCGRHPQLWPQALAQLACFTGRNARHTLAQSPLAEWTVSDDDAFFEREIPRLLDHDADEFIVSVHRLKTLLAARELRGRGLGGPVEAVVLAGTNRYLHAPMRLKQVRRTVHQAMQFVAKDG